MVIERGKRGKREKGVLLYKLKGERGEKVTVLIDRGKRGKEDVAVLIERKRGERIEKRGEKREFLYLLRGQKEGKRC